MKKMYVIGGVLSLVLVCAFAVAAQQDNPSGRVRRRRLSGIWVAERL